ncbi:MAG: phosphatase PAP2 family protein [Patescibacteria group bacterium]
MKNIYRGLALFVFCIGLGFAVSYNFLNITFINKLVVQFFTSIRNEVGMELMKSVTTFGESSILTPLIIISLMFFLLKKHWEYGVIFGLGIYVVNFLTTYAKNFFDIARPLAQFGYSARGYAYPSGHVSNAAIVFLTLALYFLSVQNKVIKYIGVSICTLATIGVGISRMYLNVHWFTDVIGGTCLALSIILILYGIVQVLERPKFVR